MKTLKKILLLFILLSMVFLSQAHGKRAENRLTPVVSFSSSTGILDTIGAQLTLKIFDPLRLEAGAGVSSLDAITIYLKAGYTFVIRNKRDLFHPEGFTVNFIPMIGLRNLSGFDLFRRTRSGTGLEANANLELTYWFMEHLGLELKFTFGILFLGEVRVGKTFSPVVPDFRISLGIAF